MVIRDKLGEYAEDHELVRLFDFNEAKFDRVADKRVGHETHDKGVITGFRCPDHGQTTCSLWNLSPPGYNKSYPCEQCDIGGTWTIEKLKQRFILAYGKDPMTVAEIEALPNFSGILTAAKVQELYAKIDLYAYFEYGGGGRRSTMSLADIHHVGCAIRRDVLWWISVSLKIDQAAPKSVHTPIYATDCQDQKEREEDQVASSSPNQVEHGSGREGG